MIGRVAGRLLFRGADHVIVEAGGVGYIVHVSERVLAALPRPGETVALWTDLQVAEDRWTLYGFPTLAEKEWHRLLLTVQGVGAKVSLSLLGALGPEALGRAIALGDWTVLARARGVGPKMAQRIANELRDRAPAVMAMAGLAGRVADDLPSPEPAGPDDTPPRQPSAPVFPRGGADPAALAQAEALSALGHLGYAPAEAMQAVARAAEAGRDLDTPGLIRGALRLLAPRE
ncbi:Holliday junction branch migration protein RuvA [Rubellimicrobium sp. CFH 75288]|uniref:Holliday junction branch migration protein RuvA n=1 Tax=Rubellimicrobium sp. CFH 75288 TaxID=2697034 RepID=UPI001413481B|nr:Holliday junction branch migration protein RuvA [Rubellimicrobium sp. CFH 75288]NAZ36746.1 Holliday junction branch migration protein RuvA [Rubellimicrobium sp. CFH 75288]